MKNQKHNSKHSFFTFGFLPGGASRGFTLVELLVSLSLFIIVVLALIGSLYTVNDASRKVQAMRTVMDNLNFAMESMGRTVRTSENIKCSESVTNCSLKSSTDGSGMIRMESTLGEHRLVEYRHNIVNGRGSIQKQSTGLVTNPNSPGTYIKTDVITWQNITSPEIDIDRARFYVDGAALPPGDFKQPNVIIQLDGTASVPGGVTIPFAIQTYLSQRTPE